MQNIQNSNTSKALALFIVFGLVGVAGFPIIDKFITRQNTPTLITFSGVGIFLILAMVNLIKFGLNLDTSLPKKFIYYTIMYNALLILAKFSLAPLAIYLNNRYDDFDTFGGFLGIVENSGKGSILGILIGAAVIFLLYFLIFWLLKNLVLTPVVSDFKTEGITAIKKRVLSRKFIIIFSVIAGVGILTAAGVNIILLPIFIASYSTLSYIGYIFMGIGGTATALALVGVVAFATAAFKSIAEAARFTNNIALIASFFWMGAALLFAYQFLWVVYFLIITSIWPLKVVTPK
jgi:hypothetical protein